MVKNMILTDETKIKVLHDGLEKVVTLAELREYFSESFAKKRHTHRQASVTKREGKVKNEKSS